MQVEENANNGSKISCQKKIGKPNQIFNSEKTTKTILPPSQTKKEEFHKPIVRYFPRPNWHKPYINQLSIVDALRSIGYPYDQNYRSQIGIRNNIPGTPFGPE